jgi:hypothetical protein
MSASSRAKIQSDLNSKISEYLPDTENHKKFELWTLAAMHCNCDFSEANYEDCFLRVLGSSGGGDGGIDAYWLSEDETTIFIYQCYWGENDKGEFPTDKAETAAASMLALIEGNGKGRFDEQLTADIEKVKKNGGNIICRLASGKEISQTTRDRFDDPFGSVAGKSYTVTNEAMDPTELLLECSQEGVKEEVEFLTFPDTDDPVLNIPNQLWEQVGVSKIVLLSAKSLAEIQRKYKTKLVDKNVRHYEGSTNRSNKDITETLKHRPERFWYGHNGITILCNKLVLIGPKAKPTGVKLDCPTVVNGCQTLNSLSEVFDGASGLRDTPVTARIIEIKGDKDDDAALHIAFATNNQTAIKSADLMANDPKQMRFQQILKGLKPKWFYERKKNEWKSLKATGGQQPYKAKNLVRKVDRDTYQQAIRSFWGNPIDAVSKKGSVWDTSDRTLYNSVFKESRTAEEIIFVHSLWKWFAGALTVKQGAIVAAIMRPKLADYRTDIKASKYFFVAHCVALVGKIIDKRYGSSGMPLDVQKQIANNLPQSNKQVEKMMMNSSLPMKKCFESVMKAVEQWIDHYPGLVHKNESVRNLMRHSGTLNEMIKFLESDLDGMKEAGIEQLFE